MAKAAVVFSISGLVLDGFVMMGSVVSAMLTVPVSSAVFKRLLLSDVLSLIIEPVWAFFDEGELNEMCFILATPMQ